MGDSTSRSAETMELLEMKTILSSLLKREYITKIDYRRIMRLGNLPDQKLEIYNILLMLKDENTAVEIFNIFRRMTARVHAANEIDGNHALLSPVVADCIFGFLPTEDVLNCRLVCQQWKTGSSNILRKRVTINFETLGPLSFCETFQKSVGGTGFQSFRFEDNFYGNKWNIKEINKFFAKCGVNIKRLTFSTSYDINKNKPGYRISLPKTFDITPWILKASNLTHLKVDSFSTGTGTKINIQLSKIPSVKLLTVNECTISVDDALEENMRIKPEIITLKYVKFQNRGSVLKNFRINDVINFYKATQVNLHFSNNGTQFDMSEVQNTRCLLLGNLELTNWTAADGKVFFLHLHGCNFIQQNQLQIQQLHCASSKVDFSVLPKTIEKLRFSESMEFISGEKIDWPNLKFLRFDNRQNYKQIKIFTECSNLVELELRDNYRHNETVNLNVNLIPKSVKRMKLNTNIVITNQNTEDDAGQENENEDCVLNLDTLILEDYLHCLPSEVSEMMAIIKPKVLVVSCCDDERVIDTTTICVFLLANKQLDKLIVGSTDDLHYAIPFEISVFSRFVGRQKSDYYEFHNHQASESEDPVGKPISEEEFDLHRQMNGLDPY